MTPIGAAFSCCKACDSVGQDEFALLVSIPASSFFDQKTVHGKNSSGDIMVDFQTEIGRTQNSHFLFLNIAKRPHTTQSDLHLSS